jgi:ADP-ribosylglycohydrolase
MFRVYLLLITKKSLASRKVAFFSLAPNATSAPNQSKTVTPFFGAVVGDIAGSTYERDNCKSEQCKIFAEGSCCTDDTVLTLATARHLCLTMDDNDENEVGSKYVNVYIRESLMYPNAGYGSMFIDWLRDSKHRPYNSWGNGSAMRASPIGWAAKDLGWALQEAEKSASVTHNHADGVKGAQAVAAAVFLARTGKTKEEIKSFVADNFGYNLNRTLASIRPNYKFDPSCSGSVPEAIIAFLESENFEDAVRKSISLGGDSDTIACITGAVAHAYYREIPEDWVSYCWDLLEPNQKLVNDLFWKYFPSHDEK